MIHELKTHTRYFDEIWNGNKSFEVRFNDRNFKGGDTLILLDYDPINESYCQRSIKCKAGYILYGPAFGIMKGFCVISLVGIILIG